MSSQVSKKAVIFKVISSWWWVILSLLVMAFFMVISGVLLLWLKLPPQMVLQAFVYTTIFGVLMFIFSEFVINVMMGARKVDPEKYPEFVKAVHELAKDRGMWVTPRMRIMPMSVPNAMAYGSGLFGQCAVAITPRLYHMMTPLQLKAVVAHEFGHIRSRDVGLMTVVGIVTGSIERLRALVMKHAHLGYTALLYVPGVILWVISTLVFGTLRMAISKEREYAADALGAWYVGSPDPLIEALQKLEGYVKTRQERAKQKTKQDDKEGDVESEEERTQRKADRVGRIVSDLMISHPRMESRIRSLESLRLQAN